MIRKKPDGARSSVAFLLAQVGARAALEFAKALIPLRLAPCDAGIVRLLNYSPGIRQQDLARKLDLHARRLVAVIDALLDRLTSGDGEMLRAIGEVARAHNEAICFGLDTAESAQLAGPLQRIAVRHELAPSVHPGYRDLGVATLKGTP
jgi:hypothetical protein